MRYRIGCVVLGLAMAASVTANALAQADEEPAPADSSTVMSVPEQQAVQAVLFVQIVDPLEDDIEVPLATTSLVVRGLTVSSAIVSVYGELVDVDDQGSFEAVAQLEEGANQIDIVASDADGNQVTTSLFVVRGDA